MNTYTKTASYDITATMDRGVDFISGLQKEVDALLADAPALFFQNKLAFLDEECFDADEALRPDFKENRLEVSACRPFEKQIQEKRTGRLHDKTVFVSHTNTNAFSSPKRKDSDVSILWENTRARSYRTNSLEKMTVSLEELCLVFLREVVVYVRYAAQEAVRIANTLILRAREEYTEGKKQIISQYKRQHTNKPTFENKTTMKYSRKKRFEFAVSTAVTFALFAFLLVRADFFPETPRAVLESQVAGPAFAVDASTSLSSPASVLEGERSVAATTSTSTPEIEVRAKNTTATVATQPASAPAQNRTPATESLQNQSVFTQETVHLTGVLPDRIIIDAIGLNVPVGIPRSTDIATIDTVLLKGAALYPPSGTLDQERNLLIMGHSSHLPVVRNQAYKAFNDIEKLTEGNVVKVLSGTKSYVYRVTSVARVPAAEAMVQFNTGKRELTLVTCDNFGDKSDRYVVRAAFIGNY